MTKRAILWCGQVRRPHEFVDAEGRSRALTDDQALMRRYDKLLPYDDFKIQANGLELAFQGARAAGVPRDEIYACICTEDICPQELSTSTYRATVTDLRRLIQHVDSAGSNEDSLLFVAVNHGMRDVGLVTSDPPPDEFGDEGPVEHLTPDVLRECLRPLQGPQVLMIAACYAGLFLPLADRANRAVIASCSAQEIYRVPRAGCAWSPFLDELFGAWCEFSLSDAVQRIRLPLPRAFERAAARLDEAGVLERPVIAGSVVWP